MDDAIFIYRLYLIVYGKILCGIPCGTILDPPLLKTHDHYDINLSNPLVPAPLPQVGSTKHFFGTMHQQQGYPYLSYISPHKEKFK